MPAEKGSQWSKNPFADRRDDERAIDTRIADLLEDAAKVLRSRQPIRAQLAQGGLPQNESDAPRQRNIA